MIIQKISLINVRKIKNLAIQPSPTTTIIIGKNGSGKTSILEAIFFLLTTKSFRKKYNKSIIKNNQTYLQIKGETHADWEILMKLMKTMDKEAQVFTDLSQVMKEMCKKIPSYKDVSFFKLGDKGLSLNGITPE